MMNLSSNVLLKELPYTQTSEAEFSLWTQPIPFSFTEWKTILSQWTMKKPIKFSSSFFISLKIFFSLRLPPTSSDVHRQTTSTAKKTERTSLPRNQVFGENLVDSLFNSPSTHLLQSSVSLNRHGKKEQKKQVFFVFSIESFQMYQNSSQHLLDVTSRRSKRLVIRQTTIAKDLHGSVTSTTAF